jgi:hypothetical protein
MNAFNTDDTRPVPGETVEAGGITFNIGHLGSVSFIDHKGHKRTVDDQNLAVALVMTAKQGSGALVKTEKTDATGPKPSHVITRVGNFRPPHELKA